jgi:hypothetical protein
MGIKYITKTQREMFKNIDKKGMKRWMEFVDIDKYSKRWEDFWRHTYRGHKTDRILDFGAGSCWCEYVGRKNGFNHIISLDIDNEEVKDIFGRYTSILEITVKYWDGKTMPMFKNDTFHSLIAKSSILKLVNTDFQRQIDELLRISRKEAIWYVAPLHNYKRFLHEISNKNYLPKFSEKRIKVVGWLEEWDSKSYTKPKHPPGRIKNAK